MENVKMLHTYDANSSFKLIENLDDGKYYLKRDYASYDADSAYFDILDNYSSINSLRYVTKDTRDNLEHELSQQKPELYSKIYGAKAPRIEGKVDMEDLMRELNQQNMELMKSYMGTNPYEDAIVDAIIAKGKGITEDILLDGIHSKIDDFIKSEYGAIPKRLEIVTDSSRKEVEGIFHEKFETILKLVERDIPTMLVGPAGTGKNHTLEQVAEGLDLEFYFSNAITQEHKLTGFIDANGTFHETQFYQAFKDGGLFFLDEVDASIPEVLVTLNAAIANKYFDFPNGKIEAHSDFRVVAAGNTMGTGADSRYTGRSQLDAATLDRFVIVEFLYDNEVEQQLSSSVELYDFIIETRSVIDKNDIRHVVSMRATINASKLENVFTYDEILETVIFKGLPENEIEMIYKNMDVVRDNPYYESLKNKFSWSA